MSDFISVLDLAQSGDTARQRALKDEMAALDFDFRRRMDAGLVPEDMKTALACWALASLFSAAGAALVTAEPGRV